MSAQLAPSANFVKHHAGQGGRNAVYSVLKHAMRDERGVGTHANANVDDARISWNRNFVFDEESCGLVPGDYDDAMQRYFDVFGAESRETEEKRLIEAEKRKYRRAKKRALERGEDVPPEPDFSKLKLEQPRYPHKPSRSLGKLSARTNSATVSAVTWVLHPSVENGWFQENFPKWREDEDEREAVERMLLDYYESLMEALQMEERSVLGVSLNMDETTPHVHVVLASVDFDEHDKATPNWQRIGGGNRVEGPAKLEKVHDDYRAALRERGYEVTDVRVSEKGRLPGPQYGRMKDKARIEAKKGLEAEERSLERWRQDLQEWADELQEWAGDTEAEHTKRERELDEREKAVEGLEAEKAEVAKGREENRRLKADLEAEKADVDEQRKKNVLERRHQQAREEIINKRDDESFETRKQLRRRLEEAETVLETVKDQKVKEDAQATIQRVWRSAPPASGRPYGSAPKPNRSRNDDFELG